MGGARGKGKGVEVGEGDAEVLCLSFGREVISDDCVRKKDYEGEGYWGQLDAKGNWLPRKARRT